MKDIYVVTHAQSLHHLEHKVGGWYDTGLTPAGVGQADATADRLAALLAGRAVEIFSSDLLRAAQTAAAIASRFDTAVVETTDLREISYGVADGKPQEWLDAHYVPAPDHNRLDHHVGIEGAETRRKAAERVYRCVDGIVARPCDTQIIVTHGFALTLVVTAWLKLPIDAIGFASFPAEPASITHLRQDDFWRSRSVRRLADTSHIDTASGRSVT